MVLANSPEYPCMVTGASARGVTASTANPAYTAGELARQFKLSETKLVVTSLNLLPNVKGALEKNNGNAK